MPPLLFPSSCSILLMFTLAKIGLNITFKRTIELIDQIKALSQKKREWSESMLRWTIVAHLEGSISRKYDYKWRSLIWDITNRSTYFRKSKRMGIEPGTTEQRRSNARTTTRPTVVWLTKMLEERHCFQHRHCNSRLHNVNMYYSNEQIGSKNFKKLWPFPGIECQTSRLSKVSLTTALRRG